MKQHISWVNLFLVLATPTNLNAHALNMKEQTNTIKIPSAANQPNSRRTDVEELNNDMKPIIVVRAVKKHGLSTFFRASCTMTERIVLDSASAAVRSN